MKRLRLTLLLAGFATILFGAQRHRPKHFVSMAWNPSITSGVTYNVYRSPAGFSSFSLLSNVSGTSLTDSTVQAGQSYGYYVKAKDKSGDESTASNEITVSVP